MMDRDTWNELLMEEKRLEALEMLAEMKSTNNEDTEEGEK